MLVNIGEIEDETPLRRVQFDVFGVWFWAYGYNKPWWGSTLLRSEGPNILSTSLSAGGGTRFLCVRVCACGCCVCVGRGGWGGGGGG